jgi:hypothetical protein
MKEPPSQPPPEPAKPAAPPAASAFASFKDVEDQRQREWLFRRHRPRHPAWKRD